MLLGSDQAWLVLLVRAPQLNKSAKCYIFKTGLSICNQLELCLIILLLKEYDVSYLPFMGTWEWERAGPDENQYPKICSGAYYITNHNYAYALAVDTLCTHSPPCLTMPPPQRSKSMSKVHPLSQPNYPPVLHFLKGELLQIGPWWGDIYSFLSHGNVS